MNKQKFVGVIIWMALTLSGCGLLPEKTDLEPSSLQSIKIPDPSAPGDG